MKTTIIRTTNLTHCCLLSRRLLVILLAFAFLGLIPIAQPADLGNGNTAEGHNALSSLTTGENNTAIGAGALSEDRRGSGNAATGFRALRENTAGDGNTASGAFALAKNTNGAENTAGRSRRWKTTPL